VNSDLDLLTGVKQGQDTEMPDIWVKADLVQNKYTQSRANINTGRNKYSSRWTTNWSVFAHVHQLTHYQVKQHLLPITCHINNDKHSHAFIFLLITITDNE